MGHGTSAKQRSKGKGKKSQPAPGADGGTPKSVSLAA